MSSSWMDASDMGRPATALAGRVPSDHFVDGSLPRTSAFDADPDLVDAGGSRLDELLRVHMPRILETHAEASRRAGLRTGDAAIQAIRDADARLDEALASIGTSIQEAVERLNHESAQALITEVRFLNLRRGEGAATALVA